MLGLGIYYIEDNEEKFHFKEVDEYISSSTLDTILEILQIMQQNTSVYITSIVMCEEEEEDYNDN